MTGSIARRNVLAGALALFCLGSALSALSTGIGMLTASRILVALGAALYTPLSAGVAVAISPPEYRGRALAKVFGGITLAQVAGVPAGAWLAYRFGWEAAFWAAAVLALLVAPLLFRMIPASVTFQPMGSRAILRALGDLNLAVAVGFTASMMTAVYVVFTYFGPLVEASAGASPETRSFMLALFGLGAVIGNHVGGFLTDRIGAMRTLVFVCASQAVLLPLFSITPLQPVLFALFVAVWSSFSWSFMAPQQARLAAIAPQAQPLALALNAAMIYVGIAAGSAISGLVLDGWGLAALGVSAGGLAVLAALHLFVSERLARSRRGSIQF